MGGKRVTSPATIPVASELPRYDVAVRALSEFTAKQGDLDLRFTPSPTALEGIAGHAVIASRRGDHYESEIRLGGEYGALRVRGRADGYDPELNQLEEFKTYRGDLERMPGNHRSLHWAQARIYGWLLCQSRNLAELRVALVYFDIASQRETVLVEHCSAQSLREYFESQCTRFLEWAQHEMAHRDARDASLTALTFPHTAFHDGQRQLAEAVYRAVKAGRCLMAQAPTGIGKTIGTLFPALKAMPAERIDKLFFLVAKTSGRRLALDSLERLRANAPATRLRVLELVAREKACEFPQNACFGASCPLAKGFYDRLPRAREEAAARDNLDQKAVRDIALKHQVCPYYLSQELARWCDVVVADYNYYFDSSAMLYAFTVLNEWRVVLLTDESHNLIERGRMMYTASLDRAELRAARSGAPVPVRKSLDKVSRHWTAFVQEQPEEYRTYTAVPDKLLNALQQSVSSITDYISEQPTAASEDLQHFYFGAMQFCRLAEQFDDSSLFDVTLTGESSQLCLRNVIPGRFLAPRFAAARSATLFSATLSPPGFYRDVLGLPADTGLLEVGSPFTAEQLRVRLVRSVSTRYRDRAKSIAPIVDLLARQYESEPGNYLAFFSSFDYLDQVADLFGAQHPHVPTWRQSRRMAEAERDSFLARFEPEGRGIGFAVLGGAFAEGIDLPGDRLIGAFVATLGLPQINRVNEEMQQRMEARFGAGYEYTYLYPGLQKVVQAAGRVIRTTSDRGVLYLIDDRFSESRVRKLLPKWWKLDALSADYRDEFRRQRA
ncbi:MAG: ATP-dependent DNA helicase [Gammaproteobacteria bacterium]